MMLSQNQKCGIPAFLSSLTPTVTYGMDVLSLPPEVLYRMMSYLDVSSVCKAASSCQGFEALSNDDRIWHDHVVRMLGDIVDLAPPGWLNLENEVRESSFGVRACSWKIRYAQLLQKCYPDDIRAEQRGRDVRRRAISLVLRGVKEMSESDEDEGEQGQESNIIEYKAKPCEIPMLRILEKVTSIPVKMTVLGDPSIGRTTSILKYLRAYPLDEPFRDEAMSLLLSATDRFGNTIYTTTEKGPGPDFHISVLDTPSGNLSAQIASLRGIDAAIIGFSVDLIHSIESVASYWVPFVRKWLGPSIPISIIGFKVDLMADGVSGTRIFEILNSVGIRSFELCLPPYKKSFWRAWTPPFCPLPDGSTT